MAYPPLKPGKKGPMVTTVPGPRTKGNPTGQYKVKKKPVGGKVVASKPTSTVTRPRSPVVTNKGTTKAPQYPTVKVKGTTKPPKKPGKTTPTKKSSSSGIGFDPQKMAKTMTNLGFDADIAEIQRQIDQNKGDMGEALKDLQGWSDQIAVQHGTDTAATNAAWQKAHDQSVASDANVNALFGGAGGGEGAAYSGVGEDLIGMLGAGDAAFSSRMNSILAAQGQDYQRRARNQFGAEREDLLAQKHDALTQKKQAYQTNLAQMMDMAWGRKQDVFQQKVAQQAMDQAQALSGFDLAKNKQDIVMGNQKITAGNQSLKAQQLALKRSQVEIKQLAAQGGPNGVNWRDPAAGVAAFQGALSPKNTFAIKPTLALQNAQLALNTAGAQGNSQAQEAIWNTFVQILNFSHGHKQWLQYRINKQGKLIYDPTRKKK
jgi:hypothetical protein